VQRKKHKSLWAKKLLSVGAGAKPKKEKEKGRGPSSEIKNDSTVM